MRHSSYLNRLRVRACGLLVEGEKLLLIELHSPVTQRWTWIPPGGEVEFGESLEEAVTREFKEETGLTIAIRERVHLNQVISDSIHALEIYFLVNRIKGDLQLGSDPEMGEDSQILRDIGFFSKQEIANMNTAPEFIKTKLWDFI